MELDIKFGNLGALHPTIKVDTPLTFDIIDKWNTRSIGFNYFVSHPGKKL